jgi:hypothetical protein
MYSDWGYKPLGSNKRESKSIMSLGKPTGRGYKALDFDSDRTITENSENSSTEYNFLRDQKKKGSRGEEHRMKAIYSTERDKQAPSEGEIIEKSDHTSYSGDKFESEDDQSDDFRLPKHHEQNLDVTESYQNIKKQIEDQKLPKIYLSTGSQASLARK